MNYDPRRITGYVAGEEADMGWLTTREKETRRAQWRSGLVTRAEARKEALREERRLEKKKK